jgi:hypothetical protein
MGNGQRRRCLFTATLLSVCALSVGTMTIPASALSSAINQMYAMTSMSPPSAQQMIVCYGFGCRLRWILVFSPRDRAALTNIVAAGRGSAEAERKAVANAVVWLDRRVGPIIGTAKRVAYADVRAMDDNHNFDCWDTTRNATSLLLVLQSWGLLKHHTVADPIYRGNVFVGQLPHNTAVLTDKKTGRAWVFDMWTVGYAKSPDVMPVEKWYSEK